jgi:hypothetical protein
MFSKGDDNHFIARATLPDGGTDKENGGGTGSVNILCARMNCNTETRRKHTPGEERVLLLAIYSSVSLLLRALLQNVWARSVGAGNTAGLFAKRVAVSP